MANFSLLARFGVDTRTLQNGLKDAEKHVSGFRRSIAKAGAVIQSLSPIFLSVFGVGLIKNITSLGLAAGETASKFKAVFGPAADAMNAKVQELRKTIPSTTAEMQDALATFAAMAKGFGLNAQAANLFSVEMVKISGDLASFHNLKSEEAFLKIRAAISGEFEPLKALGIVLSAASVKQEALNLGIAEGTKELTQSQKAIAVQSLVLKNMGVAQGDAAATSNSAANQVKAASAALKEFGSTIGVLMIPVIQDFTDGLKIMGGWIDKIKGKTKKFDEFEKMAEQALIARGEFEKFGLLDQKIFGFQSQRSKEKQARNMEKLKKRADELRESFKKLSEEDQTTVNTDMMSPDEKKAILERRKAQEEFEANLRRIKELQGSFDDSGGELGEKGGKGKSEDQEALEKRIKEVKLEQLRVQESGDKKASDALLYRIKLMSRALKFMTEFNIGMEEAAKLAFADLSKSGEEGKEPTKQEELKKKLSQIEMARIRAQASGDAAAEASLARRLEMAKEVLRLMDAGFSQDEATRLANKLSQPEDKRGDFVSSLTGEDLKSAANEAAEKGTRFQRMADGTFQKYVNGSRKGNFTEAQLQAGLEKRIEKDPTDETLKDIKNILQGKFVNE